MTRQDRRPHVNHVRFDVESDGCSVGHRLVGQTCRVIEDHLSAPGEDQQRWNPVEVSIHRGGQRVSRIVITEIGRVR